MNVRRLALVLAACGLVGLVGTVVHAQDADTQASPSTQSEPARSNDDPVLVDVVRLLEADVSSELVQRWVIAHDRRPAKVGVDEILRLKSAGASDTLVAALIELAAGGDPRAVPLRPEPAPSPGRGPSSDPSADAASNPTPGRTAEIETPRRAPRPDADDVKEAEEEPEGTPRERLMAYVLSDDLQRLQFTATSYEEARRLAETFVDRILEEGDELGDTEEQIADFAISVMRGMEDAEPILEERTYGPGVKSLQIKNGGTAKTAADVVILLGRIVLRAADGSTENVSIRSSATKILHEIVIDPAAMDFPMTFQYEYELRRMLGEPVGELRRFLVPKLR